MTRRKPWLGYDHWLSSPYDDQHECPECLAFIEEDATSCECGWQAEEPDYEPTEDAQDG